MSVIFAYEHGFQEFEHGQRRLSEQEPVSRQRGRGRSQRLTGELDDDVAQQLPHQLPSARERRSGFEESCLVYDFALEEWEDYYNYDRPNGALGGQTPYERLRQKATDPPS